MNSATIYFTNGATLVLHENDILIPIVRSEHQGEILASQSQPVSLENHIYNGLLPSIMSVLCICDFFSVSPNQDVAYGKNAIVKISIS